MDWSSIDDARLADMQCAGEVVLECLRRMGKSQTNPVAQVIAHHDEFVEYEHYPAGDVYDEETASQYYYHAHRSESGEHGHFHLFIRAPGIHPEMVPVAGVTDVERPLGEDAICHLIAISMSPDGLPCVLFTTNRWVTGETFYAADDVVGLLDRFDIDHVSPCLATNQFVSALVRLFRPQIESLVHERDQRIAAWSREMAEGDVYEDERLEVTSHMQIDIDTQLDELEGELGRRAIPFAAKKRAPGSSSPNCERA